MPHDWLSPAQHRICGQKLASKAQEGLRSHACSKLAEVQQTYFRSAWKALQSMFWERITFSLVKQVTEDLTVLVNWSNPVLQVLPFFAFSLTECEAHCRKL